MISLAHPECDVESVFDQCISKVRGIQKLARLRAIRPIIKNDADRYQNLATSHNLHRFPPTGKVGDMEGHEVVNIYTNQMSKKGSAGRIIYDKLLAKAKGVCPVCAHGRPDSLDHYLPKTEFPSLCITPSNLIPCCSYCNRSKSDDFPEYAVSQTFHSYFDDFDEIQWLAAEACDTYPITFRYYVNSKIGLSPVALNRIFKHFNDFKLKTLYETQASQEFSFIEHQIEERFLDGGTPEVERHLCECFESAFSFRRNHWKTAMYRALTENTEWLHLLELEGL